MDKETYSKGFISGTAVRFPLPRARRARLPASVWHLHISLQGHFIPDDLVTWTQHCCISSPCLPKAQIRANNLQMEPTMHRLHHIWGVLRPKEDSRLYLWLWSLKDACLRKTEAACNTPLFATERSIQMVLQSTQRSRAPIWLPPCQTVFAALKSYRTQRDVINEEPIL